MAAAIVLFPRKLLRKVRSVWEIQRQSLIDIFFLIEIKTSKLVNLLKNKTQVNLLKTNKRSQLAQRLARSIGLPSILWLSNCFLSNVCFPNLWLPNVFQTFDFQMLSKNASKVSKGLKDKVTVSLLRRGLLCKDIKIPRTISWQPSERERNLTFWFSGSQKGDSKKNDPQSILVVFRIVLANGLCCSCERMDWITAKDLITTRLKACCIEGERPCGAIGRSRLAWGQSLTIRTICAIVPRLVPRLREPKKV